MNNMIIAYLWKKMLSRLVRKYCVPNSLGHTPYEIQKTLEEVRRIIADVDNPGLKDSEYIKGLIFTDAGIESMRKYLSGPETDIKKYQSVWYIADKYTIDHDPNYISVKEVDLILQDPKLTRNFQQNIKEYLMKNSWDIDEQKFSKTKLLA